MKVLAAIACVAIVLSSPVFAQSSLGITGATLEVGSTEDENGRQNAGFASSVDVRITGVHGLQGDLGFYETATGTIGQLTGHLYMAPRPGQKYGLFLSLSDADGRSMAWVSAGAEGMLSLGETTTVEGRLGLGAADGNSMDYIFGGLSLVHSLTPSLEIEAALDVADFDEAGFRATSVETALTMRYSPKGAPWGLYASATHSDLVGRDGGPAATRIGLGITFNFGASGGTDPSTRMFRKTDPLGPLVRRGLW
jgi:hypothetical protein